MPNLRGGKSYKKSKGKTKLNDDEKVVYLEIAEDQMVGRILTLPGNMNATVYCQDNKKRLCRICRAIKKSVRFEIGDIVLISLRDFEVSTADFDKGVRGSKGDILDKFHPAQFKELKAKGITPSMFLTIDTVKEVANMMESGNEAGAMALVDNALEDFFDRSGNNDDSSSEEGPGAGVPANTVLPAQVLQKKPDDDEVDVDDL